MDFREYYLPSITITLILGYQLTVYFFYRYFQLKDKETGFNEILLGHGLLFGSLMTSLFLRTINTFFLGEPCPIHILARILYAITIFGLLGFLSILTGEAFKKHFPPVATWIFILLNGISLILLPFFEYGSVLFIVNFLPLLLGFIYVLFIQITLIKKSQGKIKKRLKLLILGMIVLLAGMFLIREEELILVFQDASDIFFLLSSPLANVGLSIIFFGTYEFPVFLELDWKKDLIRLYVIDLEKKEEILHKDLFQQHSGGSDEGISPRDDQKFLSKAILGIESIFTYLTETEHESIKRIRQEEIVILLEYSTLSSGKIAHALLVERETNSIHYFLKQIKKKFDTIYQNIIDLSVMPENAQLILSSFSDVVDEILNQE